MPKPFSRAKSLRTGLSNPLLLKAFEVAVKAASPQQAVTLNLPEPMPAYVFALGKAAVDMYGAAIGISSPQSSSKDNTRGDPSKDTQRGRVKSALVVTNKENASRWNATHGKPATHPAGDGITTGDTDATATGDTKEDTGGNGVGDTGGESNASSNIRLLVGDHPVLSQRSLVAGAELMAEASRVPPDATSLVLISGGGSALAEVPKKGITLADLVEVNEALLKAGADISQFNAVRRSLSAFKGGGLARCFRGSFRCLIISDVVGDAVEDIAAGPMVANPTTNKDAMAILERYNLTATAAYKYLAKATAAPPPKAITNGSCEVIASNHKSVLAMAKMLGATIPPFTISGEARQFATELAKRAATLTPPAVLVGGGESTVKIKGDGMGGRNQEAALAFAIQAERLGLKGWAFMCAGTDGRDGPTDAAGAIVTPHTLTAIRQKNIDPAKSLERNDSYNALRAADALIISGGTGTNVADVAGLILE